MDAIFYQNPASSKSGQVLELPLSEGVELHRPIVSIDGNATIEGPPENVLARTLHA